MLVDDDLEKLRPRMMSVAYRMLGSVADAEDAVQDAFLRLHLTENVHSPEGFLVTATTRRCIDQLRALKHREAYIGPWVPEPIDTTSGVENLAMTESLSLGFLLLLERLSPEERAAYLLRNVFDYEYSQIAEILNRTQDSTRQLVSRAGIHLKQDRARYHPTPNEAARLVEQFILACREGNIELIEQLFADSIQIHSDGGGKVSAARVIICGRNRSAKFLAGVFSKRRRDCQIHPVTVNGDPGIAFTAAGQVIQIAAIGINELRVDAVYMILNPEKLARWTVTQIE